MSERHVFHLSIPVSDLDAARRFYVDVLSAKVGRETRDWLDVLLWGHQVTLQLRPDEVLPPERQGKRHFGVTMPWSDWESAVEQVRASGAAFLAHPHVFDAGTPGEHAKFYVADPSHNVVEVKAYRDARAVLRLADPS